MMKIKLFIFALNLVAHAAILPEATDIIPSGTSRMMRDDSVVEEPDDDDLQLTVIPPPVDNRPAQLDVEAINEYYRQIVPFETAMFQGSWQVTNEAAEDP
jgi:hypothetical protein